MLNRFHLRNHIAEPTAIALRQKQNQLPFKKALTKEISVNVIYNHDILALLTNTITILHI